MHPPGDPRQVSPGPPAARTQAPDPVACRRICCEFVVLLARLATSTGAGALKAEAPALVAHLLPCMRSRARRVWPGRRASAGRIGPCVHAPCWCTPMHGSTPVGHLMRVWSMQSSSRPMSVELFPFHGMTTAHAHIAAPGRSQLVLSLPTPTNPSWVESFGTILRDALQ